jgi:hypothetical protein
MEAMSQHGINPENIFMMAKGALGNAVIVNAHIKARDAIKAVSPDLKVGLTLSSRLSSPARRREIGLFGMGRRVCLIFVMTILLASKGTHARL